MKLFAKEEFKTKICFVVLEVLIVITEKLDKASL